MSAPIVVVRDITTRAELAEIITHANAEAKAISRRGMVAMLGAEYAEAHEVLDALLEDWVGAV